MTKEEIKTNRTFLQAKLDQPMNSAQVDHWIPMIVRELTELRMLEHKLGLPYGRQEDRYK